MTREQREPGVSWRTYTDERFLSLEKSLLQSVANLEKHINLKFENQDKAVDTANQAMTIRLERMNEFRDQLSSERQDYARKDEVERALEVTQTANKTEFAHLRSDINALLKQNDVASGRDLGKVALFVTVGVAVLSVTGNLMARFIFG